MNADELRALQAPLKQQYRENPDSALITFHAEGRLSDGVRCRLETPHGPVSSGLHPAAGGDGRDVCSGDMLLEALVGCAGVTLRAVATAMGITLRDATIRAEADADFRGTLAVNRDVPVGVQRLRLSYELETDATPEQISKLLQLTERYCVVYQTLINPPQIEVSHRVVT